MHSSFSLLTSAAEGSTVSFNLTRPRIPISFYLPKVQVILMCHHLAKVWKKTQTLIDTFEID